MPKTSNEETRSLQEEVARRQRHVPAPKKIAEVLSGLLSRRGYARVQSASNCEAAWREAAGPKIAAHGRPGNVRRGVLEITVRNSAVMQELAFQKTSLLETISRLLPDHKIKDLKFRVGPLE